MIIKQIQTASILFYLITAFYFFSPQLSAQTEKKIISTTEAPNPVGPYSQAVEVGDMLFISGQIPLDPKTDKLIEGGIGVQTLQVLKNIEAILNAAGYTKENVVQCQVYLSDLSLYPTMNNVYENFFVENFPARSVIEVKKLPRDVLIEIMSTAKK
ncbi:MAG TPA: Rid family detoxifying hydrolase [Ignavibacteriaceae bacterium]|nr:Rid family detoxifying hydrolase [Ignavibacteriaceae bacterium]